MKKEMPPHKRYCPKCNKEIFYTRLNNMLYAESQQRLCKSCSQKKLDENRTRNCPNCGKILTYKNIYMKSRANNLNTVCSSCHVKNMWTNSDFKNKMIQILQSPELKRQSTRANGGKYKGWHFRSRLELFYIREIIEKQNKKWESAEKIKIPFKWKNKTRFYHPDLLIDDKNVIEIKMTSQMTEEINIAKIDAAKKWCKENGMSFDVIDPSLHKNFYTQNDIAKLIADKIIVLDKYSDSMKSKIMKFL